MRIHHINCGTMCPVGQLLTNGRGSPFVRGRLVCHCLLLEAPQGLVLVDTGFGTQDVDNPERSLPGGLWQAINDAQLDETETAIAQLRALGFRSEDVRDIVLTHLDFDHAGGIADFPWADVHTYELEQKEALHPQRWISQERYAAEQFLHGPKWKLHAQDGESWFGFERVSPMDDDSILMIPLPGHSAGHCGVAVKYDSGWVLHAGDAVFDLHELDPDGRHVPPGVRAYENVFQHSRSERLHYVERLRSLSMEHGSEVRIICSHDPDDFDRVSNVPAAGAYMA